MRLPRLKIWMICLAVAASAVVVKLALTANVILPFTTPLLFLGPIGGIALDRRRGGTGVAGGVIAGILSGLALSVFMNIYAYRLGHPFAWYEPAVSTAAFVALEASCGWLWGRPSRPRHPSMANGKAANAEGNEI